MAVCDICGGPLVRRPRGAWRRIIARASYCCERCGDKSYFYRPFFALFQRYSVCPICHNPRLRVLARRDHIDRRTINPIRRMLVLVGAPLYHCTFCRFQFRDVRGLDPRVRESSGKMAEDDAEG